MAQTLLRAEASPPPLYRPWQAYEVLCSIAPIYNPQLTPGRVMRAEIGRPLASVAFSGRLHRGLERVKLADGLGTAYNVVGAEWGCSIHGISVRSNGRLRTHAKIKTDANGRTPKLKRTQTDAPNLEKHVIAYNTPRALTTSAICKEALGTSSPPQWWWCLHGVEELEPMVLPQRTPSQSVEQHGHQDSCPCQPTFPIRVWK